MVRRRFLLALAVSMALHLTLLASPAWRLPSLDDLLPADDAIQARLAPPPRPAAVAPVPRLARPQPVRRAKPVAAAEQPPAPPVPVATPASLPAEPEPEATSVAEAVAPAPEQPVAAAAPVAIDLPSRGRIRFLVRKGDGGFVIGQASHEWRHDGASYVVTSTAETTGLIGLFRPARVVQTSEGDIVDGALRPREFKTEKNGATGDRARFDWSAGRVLLAGGAREVAVEQGSQDMLSMFYQLGLMADRLEGAGLAVATGNKLERYAITAVGEERLEVPAGERRTLRVLVRAQAGADTTEVWLGLDDRRLPLRIRHVDRKGDIFDQVAEVIELEETR